MTYRCPNCQKLLSEPFCTDCARQAEPVEAPVAPAGNDTPRPTPAPPPVAPSPEPVAPAAASKVSPPDWGEDQLDWSKVQGEAPAETSQASQESAAGHDFDTSGVLLGGQRQVEKDLAEGYEMFLVAGIGGSGKTQFIDALEALEGGFLRDIARDDAGRTNATTPNTIIPRYIRAAGRKLAFLDAPGELFQNLFPYNGSISKRALQIPKLLAPNLRGVVLVIDLEKLWGPPDPKRPDWRHQLGIAAWILEVLRWLSYDGKPPQDAQMKLHTYIDRQVRSMKQRLRQPVLVLFTKADLLDKVRLPGTGRPVRPEGEHPLLFAWHCLPELHKALLQHADHFRYDFVHSLVEDKTTGVPQQFPPCGVRAAVDWLIDTSWRNGRRGVPTRRWLSWQRGLDQLTGRGNRWKRLPEPRRLAR